jgi:UDP-N-acetylglucosamine--dolichyl-phosphate N-acetylglucosaminephosphotransferase
MIMLGFADDVFNLRWRIKLVFPFVATFPLVVSYNGLTSVVLPIQLRELFGSSYIDLG